MPNAEPGFIAGPTKKLDLIGIEGLFWYWKRAQVRKLQRAAGDPSDGYQHLRGRKFQEDFRR